MREAAADLDFEEAARLRDEVKRLRATELAVSDNPVTRNLSPASPRSRSASPSSRPHKPALDEMGIASYHEVLPDRPGKKRGSSPSPLRTGSRGAATRGGDDAPHFPDLDSMGPGTEAVPYREGSPDDARGAKTGPRSTMGKPGQRGGFKKRGR
jgi:excinuclease ABC subunit B